MWVLTNIPIFCDYKTIGFFAEMIYPSNVISIFRKNISKVNNIYSVRSFKLI